MEFFVQILFYSYVLIYFRDADRINISIARSKVIPEYSFDVVSRFLKYGRRCFVYRIVIGLDAMKFKDVKRVMVDCSKGFRSIALVPFRFIKDHHTKFNSAMEFTKVRQTDIPY